MVPAPARPAAPPGSDPENQARGRYPASGGNGNRDGRDGVEVILNIIALAMSGLAIITSTYVALKHEGLQKAANFVPAYTALLRQYQSMEFHDHYTYVTTRLRAENDPEAGMSGLPDEARRAVYDVAYFYQGFGVMYLLGVLDDEILPTMRPRSLKVWEAIEPYVQREREICGFNEVYVLRALEEFATETRSARSTRRRGEFVKAQRIRKGAVGME